jgi:hypothetical protein
MNTLGPALSARNPATHCFTTFPQVNGIEPGAVTAYDRA